MIVSARTLRLRKLFIPGRGSFGNGSLKEAESDLRYAIQSWQDLGDNVRQADAFELLGQLRDAARIPRGLSRPISNPPPCESPCEIFQGQANVLMEMATNYDGQGKLQQAEPLYIQELEIRRRLQDKGGEINAPITSPRLNSSLASLNGPWITSVKRLKATVGRRTGASKVKP